LCQRGAVRFNLDVPTPSDIDGPSFAALKALVLQLLSRVAEQERLIAELRDEKATGGIHNIPFVVKQANASRMRAVFWIEELTDPDAQGNPQFMLQYAQRVLLDFFPLGGPTVGLIRWPTSRSTP
jgi:hypothetical protein